MTTHHASRDAGETAYGITTTESFERALKRFFRKHPDLRGRFADVLALLQRDPYAPSLRTHPLRGELAGYFGVSLTHAYRILITIRVTEREVTLLDIGTHDEVY